MWFSSVARKLPLIALLLLLAGEATAQVGGASLLFQAIDPGARSRAFGETGVLLRGAPGVAMLNPAAIGRRGTVQLSGGSTKWFVGDRPLTNVAVDYGAARWAVAAQLYHLDLGKHERRDASNNSLGTFRTYDMSAAVTGAYRVTPDFSVGLGLRYLRSDHGGNAQVEGQEVDLVNKLTFDLGLHYGRAFGNDDVQARYLGAWSLTNVGGHGGVWREL